MNAIKIIITLLYGGLYISHFLIYTFSKNRYLIREDLYARERHLKSRLKHFPLFRYVYEGPVL